MFLTKKREYELIDFLANFSCIERAATGPQIDSILMSFNNKELQIALRFLNKQTEFGLRATLDIKSRPCGDGTNN